jgi:membrane-bound serine protease (ClpP class)
MTAALVVIGLMVMGLALIAIEVLVIPGFGLIGLLGAAAVLTGGYVAYGSLPPTFAALAIIGGVSAALALFWYLPRTGVGRSMVLRTQAVGSAAKPGLDLLLDREGTALTPLRPSGSVEIDDSAVDVVTDGKYVDAGTKVKVVRVEGSRVVVEPVS